MTEVAAPPTAAALERPLSDRLNPVFVRELHQQLRGRVFAAILLLALLAILAVGAAIALDRQSIVLVQSGAGHYQRTLVDRDGREGFQVVLAVLLPLLVFVIPFQAFVSTAREVRGGAAELLLLSKLTPQEIVRGKLLAGLAQSFLFLGLFAPLLAVTFLLRGVDAGMILGAIAVSALVSVLATAFAVAAGALARFRLVAPLLYGVTGIALGLATVGCIAGALEALAEVQRELRDPDVILGVGLFIAGLAAATILLGLVAGSVLTHPHENRSTGFRVFYLALLPVAFSVPLWAAPASIRGPALVIVAALALLVFLPFALFAASESPALSPRVRAHVPRSRVLALLLAPFYPGAARGFLYAVLVYALLAVAAIGLGEVYWPTSAARPSFEQTRTVALAVLGHAIFFTGALAFARARLPPGASWSWIARGAFPLAAVTLWFGTFVLATLLYDRDQRLSSALHVLNPIATIGFLGGSEEVLAEHSAALIRVLVLGGAMLALMAFDVRAALRELLDASRRRRRLD